MYVPFPHDKVLVLTRNGQYNETLFKNIYIKNQNAKTGKKKKS